MTEAQTMAAGYVYMTSGPVRDRARQLSASTGIPTPFIIVLAELVEDAHGLEQFLHEQLDEYRVSARREFFRISPHEVVRMVLQVTCEGVTGSREISSELYARHGKSMFRKFTSIKIVKRSQACFLETTQRTRRSSADELVERSDLSLVTDDPHMGRQFRSSQPLTELVNRFLRLDLYTLANCTNLLTDEADAIACDLKSYDSRGSQRGLLLFS